MIFLGEAKPMKEIGVIYSPLIAMPGVNVSENLGGTAVSLVSPMITPLNKDRYIITGYMHIHITVATDELSCMKNAGTQISMFFSSNE